MIRTITVAFLVVGLAGTGGPARAQEPVDGDTQRQRAEQILDEPRFGDTRPTLWDRLTSWVEDRFGPTADPGTNSVGGDSIGGDGNGSNANAGDDPAATGADGTEANEAEATPGTGTNGTDGSLAGPTTPQPTRGLAAAAIQFVLGAVIVVAIAMGARWLIKRRSTAAPRTRTAPLQGAPPPSPEELVDAADRASRAGDYATAVRLRFKAGLVRLGRQGVVVGGEHTTNPGISQQLDLEEFDRLAASFERVVYGGHEADASTDSESRDTWPKVIKKAKR